MGNGTFNDTQIQTLLAPIASKRILRDGKGHSHVSQQDNVAHLNRMFGFGNFDTDILDETCVFEEPHLNKKGEIEKGRWDVCYKAKVRVTVRNPQGEKVCHYEGGSTATAQNQTRGDAHDLAFKSALSLATKRATINLGDGFGLSLYNNGQQYSLVQKTLVMGEPAQGDRVDVQAEVQQQVSDGEPPATVEADAVSNAGESSLSSEGQALLEKAQANTGDLESLRALWPGGKAPVLDEDTGSGVPLRQVLMDLMRAAKEQQETAEEHGTGEFASASSGDEWEACNRCTVDEVFQHGTHVRGCDGTPASE